MSSHDDYMDVAAAYREYERAYELWGNAVDGEEPEFKPLPFRLLARRRARMIRALKEISRIALLVAADQEQKAYEDAQFWSGKTCDTCGADLPVDGVCFRSSKHIDAQKTKKGKKKK